MMEYLYDYHHRHQAGGKMRTADWRRGKLQTKLADQVRILPPVPALVTDLSECALHCDRSLIHRWPSQAIMQLVHN